MTRSDDTREEGSPAQESERPAGFSDRLVDVTREVLFGRIMPHSLLKMLGEHIAECLPGREGERIERIEAETARIKEANRDVFPDHAGQDLLGISAEIDPDRDGIRADRETTLGYGGDACPFHFTAVERKS